MKFINYDNDLTPEKFSAIKLSHETAQKIQNDLPQIADDYRAGMTGPQIALKYDTASRYGSLNETVSVTVVYIVLIGSNFGNYNFGGFITDPYEQRELSKKHRVENGRKFGKISHEQGLEIHGQTKKK